jgi:hypothetical protein
MSRNFELMQQVGRDPKATSMPLPRRVVTPVMENLRAANTQVLGPVLNKRTFPIPEAIYQRLYSSVGGTPNVVLASHTSGLSSRR